jgi:hypothetical protein
MDASGGIGVHGVAAFQRSLMALIDWESELGREGHRVKLGKLPIAMHCHHYNINLTRMLETTLGEEGVRILFEGAEEASLHGFQSLFSYYEGIRTVKSKLEFVSTIYQNCGLGLMRLEKVGARGGRIVSTASHHVTGWLAKHGKRDTPGCHFTRGWVAGALEAVYSRPLGTYLVEEPRCKMMRQDACLFQIKECK